MTFHGYEKAKIVPVFINQETSKEVFHFYGGGKLVQCSNEDILYKSKGRGKLSEIGANFPLDPVLA